MQPLECSPASRCCWPGSAAQQAATAQSAGPSAGRLYSAVGRRASPANELWTCSSLTGDARNQHRGMHTDLLGSKQSPACCKTLAISTLSVTLSSSLTQSVSHNTTAASPARATGTRQRVLHVGCGSREPV